MMHAFSCLAIIAVVIGFGVNTPCRADSGNVSVHREYWDAEKTRLRKIETYDADRAQHGEWINWYENGRMRMKTSFRHGQVLLVEAWHENGEKYLQQPFANGMAHGLWTWWNEHGDVLAESDFVHGTGEEYYFNDDGTVRQRISWHKGEQVQTETEPADESAK